MIYTRIVVTHYGGPDELRAVDEECPEPKQGEVRVKVMAAGVSLPDVLMREGVHPETPRVPFTPGWDLVGVVDHVGDGVTGVEPGQTVAALPVFGAYTEFVCLPQAEWVPVPDGLDPAESVSLVLNYVTAYQMMHRCAEVKPGQRVLIHGAAGGVGRAPATRPSRSARDVRHLFRARGGSSRGVWGCSDRLPAADFVDEIHRLTGAGVDVVFDSIGGTHIWHSRESLRPGGKVVAYGLTASLRGGRLASGREGQRHRYRALALFGVYIAASWLLPGRKRVAPYSIQWLKRRKPTLFRED